MPKNLVSLLFLAPMLMLACSSPGKDSAPAAQHAPAPTRESSVMELMVAKVAPATDILWGADNPQTDAEWQVLSDAAADTLAVFHQVKKGGSGSNDAARATDTKWQAYEDEVMSAAESAQRAINSRDIDALWEANDALYTPCESCHIDFHPGVTGE